MIDVLPAPIEAYVRANARLDAEGMLAPFAPDAVVRDEGGSHAGPEAIRAWIHAATIASQAVFTPDRWHAEGGTIVVEGPTAGAFPGSPIRFTFRFALAGQAISALEIG